MTFKDEDTPMELQQKKIGPFHLGRISGEFLYCDVGYYRFRWTYKTFRSLWSERNGINVYKKIGPITYRRFEEKIWS